MNDMSKFTKKELNDELKRREEKEIKEGIPTLLENPDFTILKEMTSQYLLGLHNKNPVMVHDYDGFIYECVMKTLYGYNIFNWINLKLDLI
jgi:late competence protein required for DNA uptake (superfamily II DNA/RNA helicase)